MDLGWGSPIGIAAFFIGAGIFFWLFFHGLEALARARKLRKEAEEQRRV